MFSNHQITANKRRNHVTGDYQSRRRGPANKDQDPNFRSGGNVENH